MKTMIISTLIIMMMMMMLVMILNLISKKSFSDREKNSPFECGFDPKSHSRLPFSLQFFMIGIIFLIFDIEIAILLPMIFSLKSSNPVMFSVTTTTFILILIIGLIHEWKQGSLNWTL
uniref:NADH-ubiquinone oxidoreductase chain 3 n=1 Tax=Chalcophana sp. N69 TaxID=2653421 RepID=A0A5Q0U0M5_9CUCU|nr:NADH dehydrogenase subunit 3 [Chalcophana sp. N69]